MIVDSTASDIVYSNLFTGVHGNYLRGSIVAAGLDPDNLAESNPSVMDFSTGAGTSSGGVSRKKAWRDIWGAGQGVGVVESIVPVQRLVDRLHNEYVEARRQLADLHT